MAKTTNNGNKLFGKWAQVVLAIAATSGAVNHYITSPLALIDLHRWVQLGQLLLEQLQVWIDKAQLQSNSVSQLPVGSGLRNLIII